jgi:hypothetical protein
MDARGGRRRTLVWFVAALVALATGVVAAQAACPCLTGTVRDGQGRAVAGLTVRLFDESGAHLADSIAVTDAAGRFAIGGLGQSVLARLGGRVRAASAFPLEFLQGNVSRGRVFLTRESVATVVENRLLGMSLGIREVRLAPITIR